jgi:hypothetical protein
MPKIIGILTRHYSKRDSNGNVYDFASYTDTETGKTIEMHCDNIRHITGHLERIYPEGSEVFYQEQEHGQRELFRLMKPLPYAGCLPAEGAKYIISQLDK